MPRSPIRIDELKDYPIASQPFEGCINRWWNLDTCFDDRLRLSRPGGAGYEERDTPVILPQD